MSSISILLIVFYGALLMGVIGLFYEIVNCRLKLGMSWGDMSRYQRRCAEAAVFGGIGFVISTTVAMLLNLIAAIFIGIITGAVLVYIWRKS